MHDKGSRPHPPGKGQNRLRRLTDAALLAGVQATATAIGSGLVGLTLWWLAHRP